jgi:integrase
MTRRNAGEGLIRQRPGGLWEARHTAADGRKHSLYAKTKREATDRLRDALRDAEHGVRPVSQQLTTAEYLDEWIESLAVRPRTAVSYAGVVSRYLKPALGRIPLAKLQPEHIGRMLRDLEKREPALSPITVRYAYVVLRIALGRALKLGRVHRNVAALIDPPAKARRDLQPMTAERARTLLATVAGDRLEALYRLAIVLGMRQRELLGLRWQDVDMDAPTLAVRNTLQQDARTLAAPKTDRSVRTLSLDAGTVEALRQHRRRQLEERLAAGPRWREADFVFASSVGTPLDHRNVLRHYHALLERAGIPSQSFHQLPHACATLLLESGEELANISKLLGHSSLATTADFYGHLTPGISRRAADRMAANLAG